MVIGRNQIPRDRQIMEIQLFTYRIGRRYFIPPRWELCGHYRLNRKRLYYEKMIPFFINCKSVTKCPTSKWMRIWLSQQRPLVHESKNGRTMRPRIQLWWVIYYCTNAGKGCHWNVLPRILWSFFQQFSRDKPRFQTENFNLPRSFKILQIWNFFSLDVGAKAWPKTQNKR